MQPVEAINARIVEALYCEALLLSEEVRYAFARPAPAMSRPFDQPVDHPAPARQPGTGSLRRERRRKRRLARNDDDPGGVALSSEGLRTTTRMMHAVAWLLNHRAYLMGELSEFQLERSGRLAPDLVHRAATTGTLEPDIGRLVEETREFYRRLLRLDQAWHGLVPAAPSMVHRLRQTIERRLAG